MNERIKELLYKANGQYHGISALTGKEIINTEFVDYAKFAELIVEECINRIEQNRSSGENTDSWTITRDMAFHQMKEDLKRHFGVE